jgi:hypothetical protein
MNDIYFKEEQRRVWVVTYHDPEDGSVTIEGVFSSEDKAIAYMKQYGFKFYGAGEYIIDKEV